MHGKVLLLMASIQDLEDIWYPLDDFETVELKSFV